MNHITLTAAAQNFEHPHGCPCKTAAVWCALIAIALLGIALTAHHNIGPFQEVETMPLFAISGVFTVFSLFMLYYVSEIKGAAGHPTSSLLPHPAVVNPLYAK